jgi:Penicillin binding protein transpeptidase domain
MNIIFCHISFFLKNFLFSKPEYSVAFNASKVCLIFGLCAIFSIISVTEIFGQAEKKRIDKKGNPKSTVAIPAKRQQIIKKSSQTFEPNLSNFNRNDELLRAEAVSNIAQDDFENEDLEVRRIAIESLGNHAGTIVVLEPNSGRILTMLNQNWAFRKSFKPCSTVKLISAIAGLKSNAIDDEGKIRNSFFPMDLTSSIAFSNNSYFQQVGANTGHSKFVTTARQLGFGEPTGINAEGEVGGKLPQFRFGSGIYRQYSHGDDFEVTALQLAVLVSNITNGGKSVIPKITKTATENASSIKLIRREINISSNIFEKVIPGMIGAVNFGTGQNSSDSSANIIGKTGSCIEDKTWLGLFASASSAVNPKLIVVVITKGSQERGSVASQIAGKVYRGLRNRFNTNELVAEKLQPVNRVSLQKSIDSDTARSEDSDDLGYFAGVASSRKVRVSPIPENDDLEQKTTFNPPIQINPNIIRPRIVVIKRDKIK